jgi:hypothetical protein
MMSTMKREYVHDQSIFYDATPLALWESGKARLAVTEVVPFIYGRVNLSY